jgi:hypothetical protein
MSGTPIRGFAGRITLDNAVPLLTYTDSVSTTPSLLTVLRDNDPSSVATYTSAGFTPGTGGIYRSTTVAGSNTQGYQSVTIGDVDYQKPIFVYFSTSTDNTNWDFFSIPNTFTYTDSISSSTATLSVLRDNTYQLTGGTDYAVPYTADAGWRWTQVELTEAKVCNSVLMKIGSQGASATKFYIALSADGVAWRWFSGPVTTVTTSIATLTEQTNETNARTQSVTAGSYANTVRWNIEYNNVPVKYIRVLHQNTVDGSFLAEFNPVVDFGNVLSLTSYASESLAKAQPILLVDSNAVDLSVLQVEKFNFPSEKQARYIRVHHYSPVSYTIGTFYSNRNSLVGWISSWEGSIESDTQTLGPFINDNGTSYIYKTSKSLTGSFDGVIPSNKDAGQTLVVSGALSSTYLSLTLETTNGYTISVPQCLLSSVTLSQDSGETATISADFVSNDAFSVL